MESGKSIARAALSTGNEFHIRRLSWLADLDPDDIDRLRIAQRRTVCAGQEVVVGSKPIIIVAGWAYRTRILSDGRRQVFGHLIPGDVIEPGGGSRRNGGSFVTALVSTVVIDAPLPDVCHDEGAALGAAYAKASRIEEFYQQGQILRLGRLTAPERLLHLLLEFGERLEAIGAGTTSRFPLPVSQEVLADTLGLTTVHVNRTLQSLRRQGLIVWDAGYVSLTEPKRLAMRVYFDRLREEPRRPTAHFPMPAPRRLELVA